MALRPRPSRSLDIWFTAAVSRQFTHASGCRSGLPQGGSLGCTHGAAHHEISKARQGISKSEIISGRASCPSLQSTEMPTWTQDQVLDDTPGRQAAKRCWWYRSGSFLEADTVHLPDASGAQRQFHFTLDIKSRGRAQLVQEGGRQSQSSTSSRRSEATPSRGRLNS